MLFNARINKSLLKESQNRPTSRRPQRLRGSALLRRLRDRKPRDLISGQVRSSVASIAPKRSSRRAVRPDLHNFPRRQGPTPSLSLFAPFVQSRQPPTVREPGSRSNSKLGLAATQEFTKQRFWFRPVSKRWPVECLCSQMCSRVGSELTVAETRHGAGALQVACLLYRVG